MPSQVFPVVPSVLYCIHVDHEKGLSTGASVGIITGAAVGSCVVLLLVLVLAAKMIRNKVSIYKSG